VIFDWHFFLHVFRFPFVSPLSKMNSGEMEKESYYFWKSLVENLWVFLFPVHTNLLFVCKFRRVIIYVVSV